MTPQERQLIDELFDRLSKLEGSPRDRDAEAAIMGLVVVDEVGEEVVKKSAD